MKIRKNMKFKKSIGSVLMLFIAALLINVYAADLNKDKDCPRDLPTYEMELVNNTKDLDVEIDFHSTRFDSGVHARGCDAGAGFNTRIGPNNNRIGGPKNNEKFTVNFPIEYRVVVKPANGDWKSWEELAKGEINASTKAKDLPLNMDAIKGYKVDYQITFDKTKNHGKYVFKIEKEGKKRIKIIESFKD
ncbi:MAG: hypothetical protein C5B43_03660 [Verrucomicrobia bacterium]|nr:MAG: hypothetical protein C5B43_03660 [Verrucomicrobiota bacterium]